VSQEVKKTKELLDKGDDLPQEDELYNRMARAANTLTAKDSLIQVKSRHKISHVSLQNNILTSEVLLLVGLISCALIYSAPSIALSTVRNLTAKCFVC